MECEYLPDNQQEVPPVPIKTYQWEDLKRARDAGGYPWTHILKPPLEGEITAEDILRETTPKRSMSRDVSRDRSHTPVDVKDQKILNLIASPGSSRKHDDEGEDKGINIPKFSKDVSTESEEDQIDKAVNKYIQDQDLMKSNASLHVSQEIPRSISPKGILKRSVPNSDHVFNITKSEKTKCCHPLVNKIKHFADKTLQKDKNTMNKSPLLAMKKVNKSDTEIRELKASPTQKRKKFAMIKLGSSDEVSNNLGEDVVLFSNQKRDHIYEDVEPNNKFEKFNEVSAGVLKSNSTEVLKEKEDTETEKNGEVEAENNLDKNSLISFDPSLTVEEDEDLKQNEHVMEALHQHINKEALVLELDNENYVDLLSNKQIGTPEGSPNITITEIQEENDNIILGEKVQNYKSPDIIKSEPSGDWSKSSRRWTSEDESPVHCKQRTSREESNRISTPEVRCGCQFFQSDALLPERFNPIGTRPVSRTSNFRYNISDHEYEPVGKPQEILKLFHPKTFVTNEKSDEMHSSTHSIEKNNQLFKDDDCLNEEDMVALGARNEPFMDNDIHSTVESFEGRFLVSTPSTVSRTECEISTSQVDSSALENLPLKRGSRTKNMECTDNKLQQRIKEQTGKIRTQAGKLKTKLQNMKTKQFLKQDRPKFQMPERPKLNFPEMPKFSIPERRKFSLPDRPRFKKINISEKLQFSDRKKFTLPERPKFNMPEMPKFKIPEKVKLKNIRQRNRTIGGVKDNEPFVDENNISAVEFESSTYPRALSKKNKQFETVSSSPTLNRTETPPPVLKFEKVRIVKNPSANISEEEPKSYGRLSNPLFFGDDIQNPTSSNEDFLNKNHEALRSRNQNVESTVSLPDVSTNPQGCSHVINEIDNDEFFVRPKGISRENIEVRQYLSNEIREAFRIPANTLATMGTQPSGLDSFDHHSNHLDYRDADPDVYLDDETSNVFIEQDDGYYTFPPIKPHRKKKKKPTKRKESHAVMNRESADADVIDIDIDKNYSLEPSELSANYVFESKTLPSAPKRKKKCTATLESRSLAELFIEEPNKRNKPDDIVVYRTEHEYVVPKQLNHNDSNSPLVPRRSRNRSRSSHGTSLVDDDRTSHGAESLTFDVTMDPILVRRQSADSPGYATVDKYPVSKSLKRSKSKTPPPIDPQDHVLERKFYTVDRISRKSMPNRPPRKKSSTSLGNLQKAVSAADISQYDEIKDTNVMKIHSKSGEIGTWMKDRPLPPPPRPPRNHRKSKTDSLTQSSSQHDSKETTIFNETESCNIVDRSVEVEVSTQTDPLPDDMDYELTTDDILDVSIGSSLRDQEEDIIKLSQMGSPNNSRPGSRTDKKVDPKINELSSSTIGRTSPTVILVERRVSSPTRINEHKTVLTEASLTVQHIDMDPSVVPNIPPLPTTLDRRFPPQSGVLTSNQRIEKLDVGKLNVAEIQANKIFVSESEGMTLQVSEIDSKSGQVSVSGIELSQNVIDEIVKKFSQIPSNNATDTPNPATKEDPNKNDVDSSNAFIENITTQQTFNDPGEPSQRPPPPDFGPLLYNYFQEMSIPPASFYQLRSPRDRPCTEYFDTQTPPPPARRSKRRPQSRPRDDSGSSSSDPKQTFSRRTAHSSRREPSVSEAGAQFIRVCQNSVSRAFRNIFNVLITYISGSEDKKDMQMAVVIFLVLVAGLIMFGLSDGSRTIHHHHWEFFNPPDSRL